MGNEKLQKLSLELLELEERWKQLMAAKERELPDLKEAKKRIASAKKDRRTGMILAVVVVLLFVIVRPMLSKYKAAVLAESGSALLPWVFTILLWVVMLGLAFFALGFVLIKADDKDLKASETYEVNKQYNEKLAADRAEAAKLHEEKVKELNDLAGTKLGDDKPKYFFQVPFDRNRTYQDIKDGMEFYTRIAKGSSLVEEPHHAVRASLPVIHLPKESKYKYMRLDGFYPSKHCRISEVLPLLKQSGYLCLYENKAYLRDHPDDEAVIGCLWDIASWPVMNQAIFKFRELDPEKCFREISRSWSPIMKFIASGLPEYDGILDVPGSSIEDTRAQKFHESENKNKYDDVYDIKNGSDDGVLRLVNAKEIQFLEKGVMLLTGDAKETLYVALTDHRVPLHRITMNCSRYTWKEDPRYHGWITGMADTYSDEIESAASAPLELLSSQADSEGRFKPDRASTIDFITRYIGAHLGEFDPLTRRQEGLTPEQFRLWMEGWYRADQANKKR